MANVWNAEEVATTLSYRQRHPFLRWLVLFGVILFAFVVAWHQDFLGRLYATDRSYISYLITLLFFGFSAQCAVRTYYVARQLDAAARVYEMLRVNAADRLRAHGERVSVGRGIALPACTLTGLIGELVHKRDAGQDVQHMPVEQTQLMDAYVRQIKGGHEIGWFVSDAMIKLGLLGTVVGFIIMLGSVTNITTFDASVMQDVLRAMSGGMGVALYTTLTGLICGLLLALQLQFLERSADDLISLMIKVVEVQVAPHLKAVKGAFV